jgi:ketosteroid isomerase-like protein
VGAAIRHDEPVDTSLDLVQRHISAFNTGDADALLADFTPDASWVTGDYTVPAGELRSFFEGAMRSIRPHLTPTRTITAST